MKQLRGIDDGMHRWLARNGFGLLRASVGATFLWFGAVKLSPGLAPVDPLAAAMEGWTRGLLGPEIACDVLGAWECLIGLGLISGRLPAARALVLLRVLGTTLAFLLSPAAGAAVHGHALVGSHLALSTAGLLVAVRRDWLSPLVHRGLRLPARAPLVDGAEEVSELRSA